MAWHDDYTNAEIETLLTNMCNWIGEHQMIIIIGEI